MFLESLWHNWSVVAQFNRCPPGRLYFQFEGQALCLYLCSYNLYLCKLWHICKDVARDLGCQVRVHLWFSTQLLVNVENWHSKSMGPKLLGCISRTETECKFFRCHLLQRIYQNWSDKKLYGLFAYSKNFTVSLAYMRRKECLQLS